MMKDEDETFAVPTAGVSFWLEEERLKDAEPGSSPRFCSLMTLLRPARLPNTSRVPATSTGW
jgi:hypothetical protein